MFKHRPFVNFVKYFLPLRRRRPRRNAVYFSKQHFYFSSTRKRKGCPVMKDEKKGGKGRGKEFTLVVSMCTRVLLTQRKTWRVKRKKKIYIIVLVCAHFIYTRAHTSFLCAYFVTRVPCGCFQANDVVMADLGAWNGGDKNRRGFLYFLNLNHNCFEVTLKQRFSLLEFFVEFIV